MDDRNALTHFSAARTVASTFGILAGIGGMTHGIGEILQGNVAPSGLMFDSWTAGPIAAEMGGDPALSIVPNLLVTGVLTLVVSAAVLVWAALFVQRSHGGWILILLSTAMLLVGGGIGSPVIGILAGVAGTAIHAPLTWWRRHLRATLRRVLAGMWPWFFGISALNGLFLFVGAVVLVYSTPINNSELFLNSFYFAVVSLLLTLPTTVAYDLERREHSAAIPA